MEATAQTAARLAGKTAIVTGGASGIGRATAALFLAEGAQVCVVDRDAADLPGALALQADVTQRPDLAPVLDRFGRVDILVTGAGFSSGGTATDIKPEDFEAVMRVHVWGTWLW